MPTEKDNTAMKIGNSGSGEIKNEKGNPLQGRDDYNDDVLKGGDSRGDDLGNQKQPIKETEPTIKQNPEDIEPHEEFIDPNANFSKDDPVDGTERNKPL
ncbi:MAG: hypothetical protein SFW35_00445 [Chitinophagales bacterium]|nr:hypothetical protein [Chitinophagales bacterium]